MTTLARRTFLQALGLSAASGFVSLNRAHAAVARPRRVIFVMSELGWVPKDWRMKPPGAPDSVLFGSRYHPDNRNVPDDARWEFPLANVPQAEFSQGLRPYYALREYLTALDGIGMCSVGADRFGDGHAKGYLGTMVGFPSAPDSPTLFDTLQKSQAGRPSIDQVIKNHLRSQDRYLTDLTSLELRVTEWGGGIDGNNFHNFLYNWDPAREGKTFRVKAQSNPQAVFDRLFPAAGTGVNPVQAGRPDVLATVKDQYAALRPRLSTQDRAKLDAHRALIADVQTRLTAIANVTCTRPGRPTRPAGMVQGSPQMYSWNADAMIDLLVASMSCDLTRVATLLLPFPPASLINTDPAHDPHHWYSHNSDPTRQWLGVPNSGVDQTSYDEWNDAHQGLTRKMAHQATLVAKLAQKLKDTPDGDGNLLDNTLIVFADEISHGSHGHDQLPVVLLGKGGGAVRPGRYVRLPRVNPNPGIASMGEYVGVPHSHVLISAAQMMGLPIEDLGIRAVQGRVNTGPNRGVTRPVSLVGPLPELA